MADGNGGTRVWSGQERRDQPPWDARLKDFVRALLALMFGAAVVWGFLVSRINNLTLVSSDAFLTIAMAVILWWFKDQADEKRAKETAAAITSAVSAPVMTVTTPDPSTTVTVAPATEGKP